MIRFLTLSVLIITSLLSHAQECLDELEKFINKCEVLELDDYLYNRQINNFQPKLINNQLNKLFLLSDSLSYDMTKECLRHNNPKLRALGLISLYKFDNFCDYRIYFDFLTDSGYCFKTNPYKDFKYYSRRPKMPSDSTVRKSISNAQTYRVSDVANVFISFYARTIGYRGDNAYWEVYFDNCDSLNITSGFLKLLLLKATGGINPLQPDRKVYIDSLKAKIEKIEDDELRTINKIYLSNLSKYNGAYSNAEVPYNDSQLISEFVKLKKETIKSILSRNISIDDVDLQRNNTSESSTWSYRTMCDWILLHAHLVFNKEDIDFLVNRAQFEMDSIRDSNLKTPTWYIACARIDTTNASIYIKNGLEKLKGDYYIFDVSFLYSQLWHLSGERDTKLIIDWFYDTFYPKRSYGPYSFINAIDLVLLGEIVKDQRFSTSIINSDLLTIANFINKTSGEQLIAIEFTSNIWDYNDGFDRKTKKELSERVELLKNEIRKQLE